MCWLLAGCASAPQPSLSADFSIKGKIGVVDRQEAWSARFVWRQFGERFEIDLWGPLGQGQTRLRGGRNELEIVDAGGRVLASGNPQALMRERLGWSLPLGLLLDWVQGRPSVQAAVTRPARDPQGRLTDFHQLGWQVRFDRARQTPANAPPHRITAERPGYRVRVVISDRRT